MKKHKHTMRRFNLVNKQIVVLLNPSLVPPERLVTESRTPNPASAIMLRRVSDLVQRSVWQIQVVKLPFCAFRTHATDDIHTSGISDGYLVWTHADKATMLVVEFFESVVAVDVAVGICAVELCETCQKGAWELVEWVEEETVDQERCVDSREVKRCQCDG